MKDVSILENIRGARLKPKKYIGKSNTPILIKSYDKRVSLYYYDEMLLNYRYVAISILNGAIYLEFTNVKSNEVYAVTKKTNSGQTSIGGANAKILGDYVGGYNYTVVTTRNNKSLILRLRKEDKKC